MSSSSKGDKIQVLQKMKGPMSLGTEEWPSAQQCGKGGGGKRGTGASMAMREFLTGRMLNEL